MMFNTFILLPDYLSEVVVWEHDSGKKSWVQVLFGVTPQKRIATISKERKNIWNINDQ